MLHCCTVTAYAVSSFDSLLYTWHDLPYARYSAHLALFFAFDLSTSQIFTFYRHLNVFFLLSLHSTNKWASDWSAPQKIYLAVQCSLPTNINVYNNKCIETLHCIQYIGTQYTVPIHWYWHQHNDGAPQKMCFAEYKQSNAMALESFQTWMQVDGCERVSERLSIDLHKLLFHLPLICFICSCTGGDRGGECCKKGLI